MSFSPSPRLGDNVRLLDDIHEYLLELRQLVNCMIKAPGKKDVVQEFLYKLKSLEKELYFVSVKLKELYKRNDTLNKTLEAEREKGRKRVLKIQHLESQITNLEFKLKVRAGKSNPKSEEIGLQIEAIDDPMNMDIPPDVLVTMHNLKNTTLATLKVIKNLFSGSGLTSISEDVSRDSLPSPSSSSTPRSTKDLLNVINELKDKNAKLTESIQEKDKILEELTLQSPKSSTTSGFPIISNDSNMLIPTECQKAIDKEKNDEMENFKEYPLRVIRSMKSSLTSMRNGQWRSNISKQDEQSNYVQKFERIQYELRIRQANMQKKIDDYFFN